MNFEILTNLIITKIYSVSSIYTPQHANAKRKFRDRWSIIIKYEGETLYSSMGKTYLSNLNNVVLLPKGCSYEWECIKGGHYAFVDFDSDLTYSEPLLFSLKNGEKVLKMIFELEHKRNLRKINFEMESIRDTYSIILNIMKSESDKYIPTDKQKRLQPAIDYISQNYNKRITNDTLAEVAGISTVYFRKLFFDVMGVSPIAYAKNLRIERAKELLESDYGTLTDIAQALGYSGLYDFSRDFKRHTGVSPSKY